MVRFAASTPALSALVALYLSRTGLRLSELAQLVGTGLSTMQRALALLLRDGIVVRHGRRYLATTGSRANASLSFAMAFLSPEALARAMSANGSVELAGFDALGTIIVTERFPDPLDEARLRRAIEVLRSTRPDVHVELVAHHELPTRLLQDTSLRERVPAMTVVSGDPQRYVAALPDSPPTRGRALGRVDSSVIRPGTSALRTFARSHGLRRIIAFGSAVRDDMRPSSDLDLLVEPASGGKPGAFELSAMVSDAERLFGRDVDVMVGWPRGRALKEAIEVEGVVLHDAG